ncbi:MAG: hypothetical protein RMJ51_00880 [Candidatus Calescibacterium sp.]|nr:hypothetical protein [Candidatus Calescibacterium sp.]MDW8194787.1 hypothetical protein [Candidatus Calescibacterium sp.]
MRRGTVLLLGLFLLMFTVTVLGIAYIYTRNIVEDMKKYGLKSGIILMYEVYNTRLIQMINKKIVQPGESPTFTERIKYIFIESDLNVNHTFEICPRFSSNPYVILTDKQKQDIQNILRDEVLRIEIEKSNDGDAIVRLSNPLLQSSFDIMVDLGNALYKKRRYNMNFSIGEEELRRRVKGYMEFFVGESLRGFINGFEEYRDGKLRCDLRINPENIRCYNYQTYWEVYVPFSISYELRNSKRKVDYTDDHKYVLYLKPHYLINVTAKVVKDSRKPKLEITIRGQATMEVTKVIKKY